MASDEKRSGKSVSYQHGITDESNKNGVNSKYYLRILLQSSTEHAL